MLHLQNMRDGEKVIKVVRIHYIAYVILALEIIGVLIVDIIFHIITDVYFGQIILGTFISVLLRLVMVVMMYIQWLNYELDLLIITNFRIIGIEQISFLNRTVSETHLYQVQEVNSKTKGLFANIFNYGTIAIQTAGNRTTISMNMCANAIQEARKILNIVEEYKNNK